MELTLPDDHLILIERVLPTPEHTAQPTIPGSVGASDEAQADIVMTHENPENTLDPDDPLVEISAIANIVRTIEISGIPGDTGCGIGAL